MENTNGIINALKNFRDRLSQARSKELVPSDEHQTKLGHFDRMFQHAGVSRRGEPDSHQAAVEQETLSPEAERAAQDVLNLVTAYFDHTEHRGAVELSSYDALQEAGRPLIIELSNFMVMGNESKGKDGRGVNVRVLKLEEDGTTRSPQLRLNMLKDAKGAWLSPDALNSQVADLQRTATLLKTVAETPNKMEESKLVFKDRSSGRETTCRVLLKRDVYSDGKTRISVQDESDSTQSYEIGVGGDWTQARQQANTIMARIKEAGSIPAYIEQQRRRTLDRVDPPRAQ